MASRHSTGFTYSLARNSCLNTSMQLECVICGRGAEFPQASVQLFLMVFIALTGFPHGVFSLRPDARDSPRVPPVDYVLPKLSIIMVDCHTPPRFRFMVSLPDFPTVRGTNFDFVEPCNIFVYCRASYFRIRPLTSCARFPLRFSSDSCLLAHFVQGGISLNSATKNFHFKARLLPPRRKRGSLAWE